MSVLVGTQEVLKLHNKEPGKARPANREQSAVEGCPRAAYGCIGGLLQTTPCIDWPGHLPGGRQPLPNRVTSELPVIQTQSQEAAAAKE